MNCASVEFALLTCALLPLLLFPVDVSAQPQTTSPSDVVITYDDLSVDPTLQTRLHLDSNVTGVIIVDQSGHGHSTTVQGAVDLVPHGNPSRIKILVLPGIYREKVNVPESKPYVTLLGKFREGRNTIITWHDKASDHNNMGTSRTATVSVSSDYFCASEITFQNTVVPKPDQKGSQAVAFMVTSPKAVFYKVTFLGSQDTLLDSSGTHLFYHCFIEGSVDFIFGEARSLYQNSVIHSVAKHFGAITAHRRNQTEDNGGFSFLNCNITGSGPTYLGRAWGDYSRVVYTKCYMDDIIVPQRWSDWGVRSRRRTSVFGEYGCRGKGSEVRRKKSWVKPFTYRQARPYMDKRFIDGDTWVRL